MIRYALACDQAHLFETWFPSSDAYDVQEAQGLVTCPVCGSAKVDKQIMTPTIARGKTAPAASKTASAASAPDPDAAQPVALLSERERELRSMLKAVREHVTKNSDYVGERFTEEARKMHDGETPHRSIYGEASLADAKALLDDGIEVHPLPIMPGERN